MPMRCGAPARRWLLIAADGSGYESPRPGAWGGHRSTRIYGRLDCTAALRALGRGGYIGQRVFFATEQDAISAGYRPCAICLPEAYARWRARTGTDPGSNRHR